MIFKVHRPSFPLSQFVDHFWFYKGYSPEFRTEKILPDGSIELMIDLMDEPKKLFMGNDLTKHCYYKNSWISGERTGYILVEQGFDNAMIGVHFKPGGAYPFFSFPISEINDAVVELDLLYGSIITDLREQLLEAVSLEIKFQVLEQFLITQAKTNLEVDEAIEFALKQILASPQMLAIKDLSDKIGITQKHLITKFNQVVGLTPKLFTRITKFQKVIQLIGYQQNVEWPAITYECGYYDQSHFIKDFVHFSGMNPTQYLVERGEYLNTISIKHC
jgi:AraC-like DNA-binding protein